VNTAASELVEGLAHHQAGRVGQAETLYRQLIAREPDNADAIHLLGMLAHGANRHAEAVSRIARAVQLRGDVAPFHNNLGVALQAMGRHYEAGLCYTEALAISPDFVGAHINFGNALQSLGLPQEAVLHYRRALELKPDCAEAHNNLGNLWLAQGDGRAAEACFRAALAIRPAYPEAWLNLGGALKGEERFEEAVICCQEALFLTPNLAEAWSNLAAIEQAQGKFREAEASSRQALRLRADYAETYNNLGNAVREQGRLAEAGASYDQAIRLRPGYVEAHWNLAHTLLLAGELERGWEEFEWRWKKKDTPPRDFTQPAWDGAPLDGRTILLHAEQGLGDAIQFIRYAELVKRGGGTVLIECPAKLAGLFETARGIDALIPAGSPLPAFDVHAPLLSLPRIFHTTPDAIPAWVPYLAAGADYRSKWKDRLAGYQGRRIGLAWRGEDGLRSLSPETLSPLADVPGAVWFSLQFGERTASSAIHGLVDLGPETQDFRDAAAAVEQMDLVISVDTSMAHLAGALGRPVWVLLPFLPDWRWLLDREDTPWYPTMRLFRQRQRGEWTPVVEAVREALQQSSQI
jgi:tetratricopeptide (TPR) repeat protein